MINRKYIHRRSSNHVDPHVYTQASQQRQYSIHLSRRYKQSLVTLPNTFTTYLLILPRSNTFKRNTKNSNLKNTNNDNTVYITAKGTLTDNPKSLAAIERAMHHREGSLRFVSSTADHPKDEKICGIKRSNPPSDWPSSVCSTRSFSSTVTTGMTTQEIPMSSLDADQISRTSCLHGKQLLMYPVCNRGND